MPTRPPILASHADSSIIDFWAVSVTMSLGSPLQFNLRKPTTMDRRSFLAGTASLTAATTAATTANTTASADDWPQWGGPRRDLVWREEGIVKTLPTRGLLPRVWSTPIGEGYSGPSVANGRVYITDFVRAKRIERIHALDAETGQLI